MLDSQTASTTATYIVHCILDYRNFLFLNLDSIQIQRLQRIQNSLARAVTRTPRHHHITHVLKSLHWLKIPERIHFKVLSPTYIHTTPCNLPRGPIPRTFANSSPSSQPALLDHQPVSPFLDPRSLLISCSPTEAYPSLHRLWNDLPPEFRTNSLPPPPSLSITRHPPPLSVTSRAFNSKLKCHLFKHS